MQDPNCLAYKQSAAHKAEVMWLSVCDGSEVVREENFGRPIGTHTTTEGMSKMLRSVTNIADSNDEGADSGAAWTAASKRRLVTIGTADVGTEADPKKTMTVTTLVEDGSNMC